MHESTDPPQQPSASGDAALNEVTHSLSTGSDGTTALQRIAELALKAADARSAHLERVDFAADEVEVIATAGDATLMTGARVPYPGSLAQEVLEQDEAEVVTADDLSRRPIAAFLPEVCRGCPALVIPLISEGEGVGALILLRQADQSPFLREDGERLRVLGDMAAISLRRLLLQRELETRMAELKESERRFRLLVNSVKDYAIFMLDPDGYVVSWNLGAERLKGYQRSEILGEHMSRFYTPEDVERRHPQRELEIAKQQGRYQEEGWRVRKDGNLFWSHVTITAIRGPDDALLGFAKVTRDLTERHKAEQDREILLARERSARLEAEAANRAKSDFLATMSHELRTPMNAIIGYTDLLEGELAGPITEGQRDYLLRVRASSRHLLGLIGDVLDVARIEAGRIEIHPTVTAADQSVSTALSLVQTQADAKGVHLSDACGREGDVVLRTDPERLQQILVNLLSNAVKFTDRGGRITITCGRLDEPPHGAVVQTGGPWIVIRIEDTGVGISPEQMESIWRPFEQADAGHTRSSEGAGLGLTISRSLARLMGGDLMAYSESGAGSTFLLVLPAADAEEAPATSELRERRGHERRTPGISLVGSAVLTEIERILVGYVARLRTDPDLPWARSMSEAELEDHAATLLVDIAEAIGAIEEAAGAPSPLVRDSQAIQQIVSQRHGERRAEHGWSPGEVRRDYQILREELERAVRRKAERDARDAEEGAAAAVEHGLALFGQFIDRAERISLAELEG
ncbi:hypothetical protein BH23GEM6_BH23GEM6_26210 [soil metagenome]